MNQFKGLAAILALVMLVLVAAPVLALEAKGKVKSIDTTKNELCVTTDDNKELVFRFRDNVKVRLDNREQKLSDLKVNDTVTVNYTGEGENLRVSDIVARRNGGNGAGEKGEKATEAKGKIKSIEKDGMAFTMTTNDNKELKFKFDKDAKVRLNDQANKRLSDLKVGDEITVDYRRDGETLIVREIRATRKE
jgi:ribosomal 50S subunit-recycling heat shock protein